MEKNLVFSFNHVDQQDKIHDYMTANEIKSAYDSRASELRNYCYKIADELNTSATKINTLGTNVNSLLTEVDDLDRTVTNLDTGLDALIVRTNSLEEDVITAIEQGNLAENMAGNSLTNIGDLKTLNTVNKTNLVGAINENTLQLADVKNGNLNEKTITIKHLSNDITNNYFRKKTGETIILDSYNAPCKVTSNKDVKLKVCGKNMIENVEVYSQNIAWGTILVGNIVGVKIGKTYTLSFDTDNTGVKLAILWDATKSTIVTADGTRKSFTFTAISNEVQKRTIIQLHGDSAGTNSGKVYNIQLENGSVPTVYSSYTGLTKDIASNTETEFNTFLNNTNLCSYDTTATLTIDYMFNYEKLLESIYEYITNGYKGSKWVSYGDSFVTGGNNLAENTWQYIIHNYFKFGSHVGAGVGGTRYGHLGTMNMYINNTTGKWNGENSIPNSTTPTNCTSIPSALCSWARIDLQIPSDADLILLLAGANDMDSGYAYLEGKTTTTTAPTDMSFVANSVVDTAWANSTHYSKYNGDYNIYFFKNAIASTIMKLQCKAPNALIVLMTPLKTKGTIGENYTTPNNPTGYNERFYVDAEIEVCKNLGIPYIDLYTSSGINNLNRKDFTSDVIHLNQQGILRNSRAIISGLKPIINHI